MAPSIDVWVIYKSQLWPGQFDLCRWRILPNEGPILREHQGRLPTLEAARSRIPAGMVKTEYDNQELSIIKETWRWPK